jgi:hypothetical protein
VSGLTCQAIQNGQTGKINRTLFKNNLNAL